ncbi:hypothetical protein GCM10027422_11230 [Hymenobacter arcticus]
MKLLRTGTPSTAGNILQVLLPGYFPYLALLLALAGRPLPAASQHLEAAGIATSLDITQTLASPYFIDMGPYVLATNEDHSHYDEIGYRLAAYGRWQLGSTRAFLQPELAYTSTQGQAYFVLYDLNSGPFGPSFFTFGHQIRRWEAAALGGLHVGRRTYVLAGPVLALNQREALLNVRPGYPASDAIFNSLFRSVEPVQLLAQAGIGITFGRFDFNLRVEQSLTPYTKRFIFEGTTYGYKQQVRQGLLTAGFLLYKPKAAPAY